MTQTLECGSDSNDFLGFYFIARKSGSVQFHRQENFDLNTPLREALCADAKGTLVTNFRAGEFIQCIAESVPDSLISLVASSPGVLADVVVVSIRSATLQVRESCWSREAFFTRLPGGRTIRHYKLNNETGIDPETNSDCEFSGNMLF